MPNLLKLFGICDHVGEKSLLIGGDNETMNKLHSFKHPGKSPLTDNNKFYVMFKETAAIPAGIEGEKITIWVRPSKYKFYSKFKNNEGEVVQGWQLNLSKIEK